MKLKEVGKVVYGEGFKVCVDEEYKKALMGLGGFGHLVITWWANKLDDDISRNELTVEKPYKNGPDIVGVFGTRSPQRPNPICISVINIEDIDYDSGIIYTSYIDAEPDTPVLDIKPYYPCSDIIRDIKMPNWCEKLPACMEDSANFDWSTYFNF